MVARTNGYMVFRQCIRRSRRMASGQTTLVRNVGPLTAEESLAGLRMDGVVFSLRSSVRHAAPDGTSCHGQSVAGPLDSTLVLLLEQKRCPEGTVCLLWTHPRNVSRAFYFFGWGFVVFEWMYGYNMIQLSLRSSGPRLSCFVSGVPCRCLQASSG